MHDELFKRPTIIARYRAGPYAESRERFLKQAYADGYSLPTVGRIAGVTCRGEGGSSQRRSH
jgi:hypothetical protein